MINDEQLHKWVNGTLSEQELEQFKLRPEYDSLVELYENTEGINAPNFDEDAMLAEILKLKKKKSATEQGRRVFLSSWMKYGVAASVLLFATWFFWPTSNSVNYELAAGEKTEGTLPDGSAFVLNAESTLSYNKDIWKETRSLNLEGEAFFEVNKGSTFTVNTPNGLVAVLGTKFNVRSRGNIIDVKCQSGKVVVTDKEGNVFGHLLANDAIRITDGNDIQTWKNSPSEKAGWVNGIFTFKNVSLAVVLDEFERQFDLKVDSKNVDSKVQISTSFRSDNLEVSLKTILTPLGITYDILNDKNIVLKK